MLLTLRKAMAPKLPKFKHVASLCIGCLLLVGIPRSLIAQADDSLRVILNRENANHSETFDTIVSIDYLSQHAVKGPSNLQYLEGFNYPKLSVEIKGNKAIISNDSIKIRLETKLFDSVRFRENYQKDSSLYFNNLYYRDVQADFSYPPFYPISQLYKLSIQINQRTQNLPEKYCQDLYNPAMEAHQLNTNQIFGLNGYLTDKDQLILTFFCGEGSGAYKVIFLFDKNGELLQRITAPVL